MLCECGCGEDAGVYTRTRPARGHRAGQPRIFIKGHALVVHRSTAPPSGLRGGDNPAWRGDDVGYVALHHWVERHRPKTGTCKRCGATGYTENANVSGEYHRDLDDFIELCVPCHIQHDNGRGAIATGTG